MYILCRNVYVFFSFLWPFPVLLLWEPVSRTRYERSWVWEISKAQSLICTQWMQSYQMLSSHFADAHHADGISWHRYTIDGRLHESTRARGRSLTRLRGHGVMRFQQRLIIKSTARQSLIRLFIIPIWFDRFAGLQLCTWKCGWLSMCDSSAAVLLRCVKGLSSLRMSCTSSTLLSLTASSRVSSRLSAL